MLMTILVSWSIIIEIKNKSVVFWITNLLFLPPCRSSAPVMVSSYSLQEGDVHGPAGEGPRALLDPGGEMHRRLQGGVRVQQRGRHRRRGKESFQSILRTTQHNAVFWNDVLVLCCFLEELSSTMGLNILMLETNSRIITIQMYNFNISYLSLCIFYFCVEICNRFKGYTK